MWIWLIIGPAAIVVIWLALKARRGHLVGVHLGMFGRVYEQSLAESGSAAIALRKALDVFQTCPCLCELTATDRDMIANILSSTTDPKAVVDKLVLELQAHKALEAFRNESFLRELALIYSKKK